MIGYQSSRVQDDTIEPDIPDMRYHENSWLALQCMQPPCPKKTGVKIVVDNPRGKNVLPHLTGA